MLDFRLPELKDKSWATQILTTHTCGGCEYTFGNIFMWSPVYDTRIAQCNGFLVTKSDYGEIDYCFPVGDGDLKKCINELERDAHERGIPLRFFGLTKKNTEALEALFPGKFDCFDDRDSFDYVYLRDSLALLPGKKYHAKKNHISAFVRDNEWRYEELNEKNLGECAAMNDMWEMRNREKNPDELSDELAAMKRAFANYFELDFSGGLIRANGRVAAFTMGERINSDTFCTHFEKAFADIRGAYPIINREFAANTLTGYKYINREDDTGEVGLRQAKLSYHPEILLEKYIAVMKY